jgi:hypothetical protein
LTKAKIQRRLVAITHGVFEGIIYDGGKDV